MRKIPFSTGKAGGAVGRVAAEVEALFGTP